MDKFIIGTFLLLGFGFYQLSGGTDFQPEQSHVVELAAVEVTPAAIPFHSMSHKSRAPQHLKSRPKLLLPKP